MHFRQKINSGFGFCIHLSFVFSTEHWAQQILLKKETQFCDTWAQCKESK